MLRRSQKLGRKVLKPFNHTIHQHSLKNKTTTATKSAQKNSGQKLTHTSKKFLSISGPSDMLLRSLRSNRTRLNVEAKAYTRPLRNLTRNGKGYFGLKRTGQQGASSFPGSSSAVGVVGMNRVVGRNGINMQLLRSLAQGFTRHSFPLPQFQVFRDFMMRKWNVYTLFLTKRPLMSRMITCGIIVFIGDLTAQKMEYTRQYGPIFSLGNGGNIFERIFDIDRKFQDQIFGFYQYYDFKRALVMVSYYALMATPALHMWYSRFLDRAFKSRAAHICLAKVGLEMTLYTPVTTAGVIGYIALTEGQTLKEAKAKIQNDFKKVYSANLLWTPIQFVNFMFIRAEYRILFMNVASLFMSSYINYVIHNNVPKDNVVSVSSSVPIAAVEAMEDGATTALVQ